MSSDWRPQFYQSLPVHNYLFLIEIRSTSTRHVVTKKRSTKTLEHTKNLFRENLQLQGVC